MALWLRQLIPSIWTNTLWSRWVREPLFPLAFFVEHMLQPITTDGVCASPELSGGVFSKAFQPSVRVSCSQGCFDAMRRCDMTFGIWAHASQCQGQGQPRGDWLWPIVQEWACQSNTSGWVVILAAGLLKHRGEGEMKGHISHQKRRLLIFLWESLGVEVETTGRAMKLAVITGSRNYKDDQIQNFPNFNHSSP